MTHADRKFTGRGAGLSQDFRPAIDRRSGRDLHEEMTMAIDPVCKMTVDESKAAGKSEYNGKTYYFCAMACKTKFDQNPQQYIKG